MEKIIKPAFSVIGKEGSTEDGAGFIRRLWDEANGRFAEVSGLAKRDPDGSLVGIWGAMSDMSRAFRPWEDGFSRGLYLAGVEAQDGAEAPDGWTKWVVAGFEYRVVENDGPEAFSRGLEELRAEGLSLAGAAHDFTCPQTGKEYIWYPVHRLEDAE